MRARKKQGKASEVQKKKGQREEPGTAANSLFENEKGAGIYQPVPF
jgi:hypothetical protein